MVNEGTRAQELLDLFAKPGFNPAQLLSDRHAAGDIALRFMSEELGSVEPSSTELSYGELREKSMQFAAALSTLGVGRGDRVATLMGACTELVIASLGLWRLGAVAVPLSVEFDHETIAGLVQSGGVRLVICDANQRRKLVPPGEIPTDASLPVIVARGDAYGYDHSFSELLASAAMDS